jgi:hypothetical protein
MDRYHDEVIYSDEAENNVPDPFALTFRSNDWNLSKQIFKKFIKPLKWS